MKTRWLLLLGCLLAFASQAQEAKKELWKWTDANGVVHYSDVPGPGAVKVDLAVIEAQPGVAATPAPSKATQAAAPVTYSSLEVWQPANDASFFGADTVVDVRVRSSPAVSADDSLLLYLDGKLVEGPANSLEYTLTNVERGAHSLTASIIDAKGTEKIRSKAVVFYIKQATIIPPAAVGPNVKPTPKGGG